MTYREIKVSMLNTMFKVLFFIATPALAAVSIEDGLEGEYFRILYLYLPSFLLLVAAAFLKGLPFTLRALILLGLLYLMGVSELYLFGFRSLGYLYFVTAAIMGALIFTPRTGWVFAAIATATIILFLFLYTRTAIPYLNAAQSQSYRALNWISPTLSFLMLLSATLTVLGIIIRSFQQSLSAGLRIQRELEQDKQSLAKTTKELEELAFYDNVTGLPNHTRLGRDLNRLGAEAGARIPPIREILIEILNFEGINIRYGLETGNEVLRLIAYRLQDLPSCGMYRMIGARFLIHCQGPADATYDEKREWMATLLRQPLRVGEDEISLHFKAVEIRYPQDVSHPSLMMQDLLMALNDEQHGEIDTIAPYNTRNAARIIRRNSLKEQLEAALEREELSVFIQPRLDARSGGLTGGELLLRWDNQQFGSVSPDEFIPIAEKEHTIFELTHFVFQEACRFIELLPAIITGGDEFTLSVNVSPIIIHSNRLREYLSYTRKTAGFPFEFELTEGVFLSVTKTIWEEINSLHKGSVRLSIDDFGTGYSNIEYLQNLNVDILKIDKKFIKEVTHNKKQLHLVRAIVNMAKALDLKIVAEGVEYREQYGMIQELGVDEIQGFLLAKPMPLSDFPGFYRGHRRQNWT